MTLFDLTKGAITLDDCLAMDAEDFRGWLDDAIDYRNDVNKAIAAANAVADDD